MLYARETRKQETYTAFGIILKMANHSPQETLDYLGTVLEAQSVPSYYAQQLVEKIGRPNYLNSV